MKEYKLHCEGYTDKQIATAVNKPVGLVKAIIFSERIRVKRKRLQLFKNINKPS